MPVILEKVTHPSQQDLIDLEKIYNDYPTNLRFAELQSLLTESSDIVLYGARFNARLLGAITVTQEGKFLKLDHLCVRKITRQRNVARELLRQLGNTFTPALLQFESCIDDPAITALFATTGFTKQGNLFSRSE